MQRNPVFIIEPRSWWTQLWCNHERVKETAEGIFESREEIVRATLIYQRSTYEKVLQICQRCGREKHILRHRSSEIEIDPKLPPYPQGLV